jgi:hypothetical protein
MAIILARAAGLELFLPNDLGKRKSQASECSTAQRLRSPVRFLVMASDDHPGFNFLPQRQN